MSLIHNLPLCIGQFINYHTISSLVKASTAGEWKVYQTRQYAPADILQGHKLTLFRNNDVNIRPMENHTCGTRAVLIRRTVPATLRGIDLAGIAPFLRPRDTAAADLIIVRFFISVDVLVADTDLVAVPLKINSVMIAEWRIIPVATLAAYLAGEIALSP